MKSYHYLGLTLRYFFMAIIGIVHLISGQTGLIYKIFFPLTLYPSYFVLNMLLGAELVAGNVIHINGYYASLIPACIAASAYFLLIILNLSTPMRPQKRFLSLIFLLLAFLIANIARIIIFGLLLAKGYAYFDITHLAAWYLGSTLLVVFIWFAAVFLFNMDQIPVYSDFKFLLRARAGGAV